MVDDVTLKARFEAWSTIFEAPLTSIGRYWPYVVLQYVSCIPPPPTHTISNLRDTPKLIVPTSGNKRMKRFVRKSSRVPKGHHKVKGSDLGRYFVVFLYDFLAFHKNTQLPSLATYLYTHYIMRYVCISLSLSIYIYRGDSRLQLQPPRRVK